MSRTYNTQPYQWQEMNREAWRSRGLGYPKPFGGAWPGRKWAAQRRNRQKRHFFNKKLRQGIIDPKVKGQLVKKSVAWDIW